MKKYLFLVSLCLACSPIGAQEAHNAQPFSGWLAEFKQEAMKAGISQATLDEAFADTKPLPRVIELDRKQPESVLTLEQYLEKIVSAKRIADGRGKLAEHKEMLARIGGKYGVEPEFIVALWGIETNYGGNTGSYSIVDALATLAYDGRRSAFFRKELLNTLKISESENISPRIMEGSWAGAMGQCQFMPSSFLAYAVDEDGDGRRDIWHTEADIFASIANYLKQSGWRQGEDNTKVILKWNRSTYFATAVNKLAGHFREQRKSLADG